MADHKWERVLGSHVIKVSGGFIDLNKFWRVIYILMVF